jgi:ABC-type molybdate transport system permease subunit
MLKPISAALAGVDSGLEEAAKTLGAREFTVFKTVIFPLVRPSIVAGIIMTFMRSLSETGATLAVSENIKTIPVLLVDLFAKGTIDDKTILACIILFMISGAFIILLKIMDAKNAKGGSKEPK